jgi:ABC-type transporter Mla subunit MlaD
VRSEAKVGAIFVLVVLVAAAAGIYLGGYWQRLGTYCVYLRMSDAGGVPPGADIMLSGVKIGVVATVDLKPDPINWPARPVRMALALKRGIGIPTDYTFSIAQGGLLANRFISVDPPFQAAKASDELLRTDERGHVRPALKYVQEGAEIPGGGMRGLASLDTLADSMKEALPDATKTLTARVNSLTDRVERTFLSDDNARMIRQILQNVGTMTMVANRAALQAARLSTVLRMTAERSGPPATMMIKDLAAAAANVRAVAQQVNRLVSVSNLPGDVAATGQHIRQAAAAMDDTAAAIRKIAADPVTQERLTQLTDNLARGSASLARLTEQAEKLLGDQAMQEDFKASIHDLRSTSRNLSDTMEHLHKVLTDPGLTDDLRATVHNMRDVSARGTDIAEKTERSLDRVDRTMDRLGSAVSSLKPAETHGRVDLFGVRGGGLQADLDLDFFYGPRHDQFWRLGIVDLGGSEHLDFQRGFRQSGGPWSLRAGVIASKPGLGVDWSPAGRSWRVQTQLYDPSQLTLDVGLLHSLGSNWFLSLGMRDAFGENQPFVGVRREFPLSGSTETTRH